MKKVCVRFFTLFLALQPMCSMGQSTWLHRNADDYFQLERFDILNRRISDTLHTALNGMSRQAAVYFLENYEAEHLTTLRDADKKEIDHFISKNGEWAENGDATVDSRYPVFNTLYQKKTDLLHYSSRNVFFSLNPVLHYQQTVEQGSPNQNLFYNSRGLEARGLLGKRIGFYTILTDNQERGPSQHQQYVLQRAAVPGASFFKPFKTAKPGFAQDYLYASGYVDLSVIKNMLHASFGTDRFQIGDGYRSLFLSDFGSNYTFLKLNTHFWKLHYQNLYMELTPQYMRGPDALLPRKYATMHHLSANVTKWLNIGLFESIVFGRKDHFDFRYMNPIIFYRSVEQNAGSPDNAMLGMNFKINPGIGAVIYGQVLLDEFQFARITRHEGWWGNKYGLQLGFKLADLFGIRNFLLQTEWNLVRPYTYSFKDSVADHSHYNQPLAHPYGANFMELALIVKYKPHEKCYLSLKSFYNRQGRDTSASLSFGGDIFKPYLNRNADEGIYMYNGSISEVLYSNLNLAYEWRNNLFFDLGATFRYEHSSFPSNPTRKGFSAYAGIRLNSIRREYDY